MINDKRKTIESRLRRLRCNPHLIHRLRGPPSPQGEGFLWFIPSAWEVSIWGSETARVQWMRSRCDVRTRAWPSHSETAVTVGDRWGVAVMKRHYHKKSQSHASKRGKKRCASSIFLVCQIGNGPRVSFADRLLANGFPFTQRSLWERRVYNPTKRPCRPAT